MTTPSPIRLDFVRSVDRAPKTGLLLLVLGIVAAGLVAVGFESVRHERDVVEARLDAVPRIRHAAPITDVKLIADLAAVQHDLWVPWTPLMNELEAANHDMEHRVSILSVVPDPAKHTVRVVAEVRQLPDALKLLERLQQSRLLRYPMLESHELRKDDPEHPIRIKLSAEWRT